MSIEYLGDIAHLPWSESSAHSGLSWQLSVQWSRSPLCTNLPVWRYFICPTFLNSVLNMQNLTKNKQMPRSIVLLIHSLKSFGINWRHVDWAWSGGNGCPRALDIVYITFFYPFDSRPFCVEMIKISINYLIPQESNWYKFVKTLQDWVALFQFQPWCWDVIRNSSIERWKQVLPWWTRRTHQESHSKETKKIHLSFLEGIKLGLTLFSSFSHHLCSLNLN